MIVPLPFENVVILQISFDEQNGMTLFTTEVVIFLT